MTITLKFKSKWLLLMIPRKFPLPNWDRLQCLNIGIYVRIMKKCLNSQLGLVDASTEILKHPSIDFRWWFTSNHNQSTSKPLIEIFWTKLSFSDGRGYHLAGVKKCIDPLSLILCDLVLLSTSFIFNYCKTYLLHDWVKLTTDSKACSHKTLQT